MSNVTEKTIKYLRGKVEIMKALNEGYLARIAVLESRVSRLQKRLDEHEKPSSVDEVNF